MTLQQYINTLTEISEEDIKNNNVTLAENEYMLKINGSTGFMSKLNKDKTVPKSFSGWGRWGSSTNKTYLMTEEYRSGWKFLGLRHGQSAAWVRLQHPFGFTVEINKSAFEDIAQKITMVNGTIITPCYFKAAAKNAKLLVNEHDASTLMYQIQEKISENPEFRDEFRDLMIEKFPAITFQVLI